LIDLSHYHINLTFEKGNRRVEELEEVDTNFEVQQLRSEIVELRQLGNFYKNVFWVVIGIGGTVAIQNLVRYFH